MRFGRWAFVLVGVASGVIGSACWSLKAQDRAAKTTAKAREAGAAAPSVQDALLQPLDLPFADETSLEAVRAYLAKSLKGPVVLDPSALDRLDLTADDVVQLDLKGVRLKVGLKLLLDPVGLSFRVEPEDNLLILTDAEGSDDPNKRTLAEIKALHRDLHDLQDAVDDLRDLVEEELGVEPPAARNKTTLVVGPGARPARVRRARGS